MRHPQYHSGGENCYTNPKREEQDDYRMKEVLFGNGGYYDGGWPWYYLLTECFLIGNLQTYYTTADLDWVKYRNPDGTWSILEELMRGGFIPYIQPWDPQPIQFARVWVRYTNGLNIIANGRSLKGGPAIGNMEVSTPMGPLTLPESAWVAYYEDESLLAYSAYAPGTNNRIDYLLDKNRGITYLDPRGNRIFGTDKLSLWEHGQLKWEVDPAYEQVTIIGEGSHALDQPQAEPLVRPNFQFNTEGDMEGWSAMYAVSWGASGGSFALRALTDKPILSSPRLQFSGASYPKVHLRMESIR
jgi:hypothetical protein